MSTLLYIFHAHQFRFQGYFSHFLGLGGILVIFRFQGYFGHFGHFLGLGGTLGSLLGLGSILVIF